MFSVDYTKVLQDVETPSYLKELVRSIQQKGNGTVGAWIKGVSTFDLINISLISAYMMEGDPREKAKFANDELPINSTIPLCVLRSQPLLVNVLASAEGLDVASSIGVMSRRLMLLDKYIGIELLKRKGINLRVKYENMSLSEDISGPDAAASIVEFEADARGQLDSLVDEIEQRLGEDFTSKPTPYSLKGKSSAPKEGDRSSKDLPSDFKFTAFKIEKDGSRSPVSIDEIPATLRNELINSVLASMDSEVGDDGGDKGTASAPAVPKASPVKGKFKNVLVQVKAWVDGFRKRKIKGKMET